MVNPLDEYYKGVKGLIRGKCGGVALVLSPPLTQADKLVSELGEDRVRHYVIGSRNGRKEVEALRGILEEIRGLMMEGKGLVSDEKLMSKLRALLGDELVRGVKPDCVIPYYIAWDDAREYVNKMDVDEGVKNALGLIINGFENEGRRITWFGLDYMPEELVEEVKSAKSEDVERWIKAYLSIVSKLDLDEGFSDRVRRALKEFTKGHFGDAIKALLSLFKVPEPYTQAAVNALSFIAILLSDKHDVFGEIINVLTQLRSLSRDGGLNVLGRLIVHKLAVSMGLSYEDVYNALTSISGLGVDELRSIASSIAESVKEIEERLRVIDEIKRWTKENKFEVYDDVDFEDGKAYPGILVRGNGLVIEGSIVGESVLETHRVIVSENFNALKDEVLRRLNDEGVAVLVGPRGIGKTTLAAYVTWTLLREGKLGFMVNVKDLEEVGTEFTGFIGYYLGNKNKYDDKYGDLLVVYDPSTTKTYSLADKKTEVPKGINNTLDTLLRYIAEDEKVRGRVKLLVVLPTDIHQALPPDLKDRLSKLSKYVLDLEKKGFLKDPEFLAAVVIEYARSCSIDYNKAKALADEILGRFSEGYTLIARFAGTLIASKHRCNIDDVRRIIEESRGNANYFILRYINTLFKIHEDPNVAKALVEIFALRRPFVNITRPGVPILTPGIVGLIGEVRSAKILYGAEGGELRGWLVIRQHDLIEEAIKKLLKCIVSEGEECKELGDALKLWMEAHVPKIRSRTDAVKYFARKYGKRFIKKLRKHKNCWKRAALIIGAALAGYGSVPRPEDLPGDLVKSFGDALSGCGVDEYLLVGNEIPPLIQHLIKNHVHVLTKAFIDKYDRYDDIVNEVNNVLKNARGIGINVAESVYGLGLASIIANVAKPDKTIKPSDADVALYITSFTMKIIISADCVKPILHALKPLRDYAPQRYLGLLALASYIGNLDRDTVMYILNELNEVLNNYGSRIERYAWSLVNAIIAYADLLGKYLGHFNSDEVGGVVGRVADLLNELGRFKTSLGIIAWAYALNPALIHGDARELMEEALGIDVVDKASEVLGELNKMRERVQDLMSDKEFMSYIESKSVKADEEAVKIEILYAASSLKQALAIYRLGNDELREATRLFNEVAEEYKEIGDYENYLTNRNWALRAKAIEGSLVGGKLVDEFKQLYKETFKRFELTARYLSTALHVLGNYLVSLALTGDYEMIGKLLEEHWWVLNADYEVSVLTRLMLNVLLGSRVELGSELKGKLSVDPKELIVAFKDGIVSEFLPALMVAFDLVKPEDGIKLCEGFIGDDCIDSVLAVKGNSTAIEKLRDRLIDIFREWISEGKMLNLFKRLGVNVDKLFNEFRGLVNGPNSNELDGKSPVQLIAPRTSMASLALMLYALINHNEKLVKAHALYVAVGFSDKLLPRLFLDVYKACEKGCDLGNEGLRQAITKLFLYHI